MKKIVLILAVLLAVYAAFAVDITLKDGRVFRGDLLSAQENRVVIQDEGVVIQIPSEQIKTIFEEGQDATENILARASLGQATDLHYIEDDDFFVSEVALGDNPFMIVKTAKLINPPTQASKMQGQFMLTGEGTQIWTKNYFSTKIGKLAALKPGSVVIYFESKGDDGIMRGPQTDEEKRTGVWIMAKVVDLTKAPEGYIVLSNENKVGLGNIRVITK